MTTTPLRAIVHASLEGIADGDRPRGIALGSKVAESFASPLSSQPRCATSISGNARHSLPSTTPIWRANGNTAFSGKLAHDDVVAVAVDDRVRLRQSHLPRCRIDHGAGREHEGEILGDRLQPMQGLLVD